MEIEFRKLQEEYLEKVRNWRNKPDIRKYMYTDHEITKEEHKIWFETKIKNSKDFKFWLVFLNRQPVGAVHLYDINEKHNRCYWGYYLAEKFAQGIGLGKIIEFNVMRYVFEILGMNKLCCEVFTFNNFVIELHKKYGSQIEGEFKEHIFKDGKYLDIVCMAILKSKWLSDEKERKYQIIPFE